MKILVSANTCWYLWNFRKRLIKEILENGDTVVILAPQDDFVDKLTGIGCLFRQLPFSSKSGNWISEATTFVRLFMAFREVQPDCYLGFTVKPVCYGGLIGNIANVRSILTITGLGTAFINKTFVTYLVKLAYRVVLKSSSWVFFQNDTDRTFFLKKGLAKEGNSSQVSGSGVSLDEFAFQPARQRSEGEGFIFLMLARVLGDKGVYEYISSVPLVREKFSEVRFQLAGQISADNATAVSRKQVAAWESELGLEYLGFLEDVERVIAGADCIFLPSYREGLPRSLLEAGAVGRPVIATDVPGCNSVVEAGITGMLCMPRSPIDLGKKMVSMIAMPQENRAAMGRAARHRIERKFSDKKVNKYYISRIYEIGHN